MTHYLITFNTKLVQFGVDELTKAPLYYGCANCKSSSGCLTLEWHSYDPSNRMITIRCESVTSLIDIDNQLKFYLACSEKPHLTKASIVLGVMYDIIYVNW